jgi:hypothetical protein
MLFSRALLWVHAVIGLTTVGLAAPDAVEFNRDVRPILSDNCFHCHGQDPGTRKGGLRLDVRDAALKGGKSGTPAVVPGNPEESELLLRAMSPHDDEQMPPADSNKARLSATDLAKLKAWIAGGAEYQDHWAFIPPRQAPVPGVSGATVASRTNPNRGLNAIDQFVSARLGQEGLSLAPEADAETLCRRLYLDVTGLPPSPAEVAAFKREGFGPTLERLLQSEAYGEKWARLWLDAARYSDSNGYEKDLPREQWAWRDWVIRSLNRDQPYDQFIVEQIAGDLLPNATQEQIVATGFLRNSMTNEEGAIVTEQFRTEEIFDRMDCVGKAVLGLTLSCAQCHTHKFDPIEHDEYFGLFAFINDTYEAQSWVYTKDQQQQVADVERAIAILEERVRAQQPNWRQDIAAWETSVREKQIAWTPLTATEMGSNSGLNHPTQNADASIFVLGHPSTRGTIYVIATPELRGTTGLRLEALTHRDLPFNGPGRSKYGTWALSELTVTVQTPGTSEWVPVRLKNATTDFAESAAKLESDWDADFDKEKKRTRGPVEFLIDGNKDTGWRADRGPGQRNQESVAVVQFECPLEYPAGTKFRVLMAMDHGGSDNGRHNTILGRLRLSLTGAPDPTAQPIDHAAILALAVPSEQRSPAEQRAIFTAWRQSLPEAASLTEEFAAVWKTYPQAPTSVLHLAQRAPHETRETRLLDRGGWDQPKHVVAPGTPAALHPFPADRPRNRLGLAEWLVDRRSPLTARVAVNRVWQAVFGQGLAETPEDFGTRAPIPVYSDLLDWLAVDFMDHGWSQKRLLRTLLSSAVYRQSSRPTPELLERDPRNVLLARGPRFRLEAEVLRDTALKVAGLLTEQVGGPSIFPPVPASVLEYNYTKPTYWIPATGPERYRRALYVFRKRSMPDPVLNVFDAPNGDLACVRRARSNTPLAALTNLNEPIFVEAAQALALRILREGGSTDAERADFAYRLCTSRPIKPTELEPIATLLRDTRGRLAEGWLNARELATGDATLMPALPPGTTPQDAAAWTVVARVLLNLDETLNKS